jgi:hypothetical protein
MRWAIEQRLCFIEHTLQTAGTINRADIMEQFRVSLPQASTDLGQYNKLAPKNMDYDLSAKRYVRARKFKAIFKN